MNAPCLGMFCASWGGLDCGYWKTVFICIGWGGLCWLCCWWEFPDLPICIVLGGSSGPDLLPKNIKAGVILFRGDLPFWTPEWSLGEITENINLTVSVPFLKRFSNPCANLLSQFCSPFLWINHAWYTDGLPDFPWILHSLYFSIPFRLNCVQEWSERLSSVNFAIWMLFN